MSDPLRSPRHTSKKGRAKTAGSSQAHPARATGRPLDDAARTFFEPRFGYDFSRVRVHTGPEAAESANDLNARAFADGQDIVFGNQQSIATPQGMGLLAHELAHVVQQGRGGSETGAEAGANAAVQALARGEAASPQIVGGAAPGTYRQGAEETPPVPLDPSLLPVALQSAAPAPASAPAKPKFATPPGGFATPHLSELSTALPKAPTPDLTQPTAPGPRKPQTTISPQVFKELAPKSPNFSFPDAKKKAPEPPSTLSVPGVSNVFKLAIRLTRPSPDTKIVAGKVADAYVLALAQMEATKAQLTGNVPPGVDKGELVKILYSIISTYFLKDFTEKLAASFTSKDDKGVQYEIVINMPTGGSNSPATVQSRFSSTGAQAASAVMLGLSFKWR